MKIAVVLGTRPEIIKMAPVIRELGRRKASFFILHTGQHYSYNLDRVFFEQLGLPQAKYNLEVGSGSHAEETAKILTGVEEVLQKETPDTVLVEGDTNSVLAGALAATHPSAVGEIFNIATGKENSIKELVGIIKQVSAKESQVIYAAPRAGEVRHSRASIEKAQRLLGYNPETNFKEGLLLTWKGTT